MAKLTRHATAARRTISDFSRNKSGNVMITFGFSALVMFATGGGAVDFARWYQAKNKYHAALDSASLAAGRALQLSANDDHTVALNAAKVYFDQMKPAGLKGPAPTFSVIENGTVIRAEGTVDLETSFLGMLGISSLASKIVTEAVIAAGGNAGTNLEVSLMLDTTGSMSGSKIDDLKLAAKDLIDIVVWQDQSQHTSKVALAPFSVRVNVGSYLQKVTDVQDQKNFSGTILNGITCVTERTGDDAFTDAKPVAGSMLGAHRGDTGTAARDNPSNYSADGDCRTSGWSGATIPEIMPLTSDKNALKSRIDSLPASGATAGSLGTAWAWYLLSPKWTGIWQGDSMPAPYSDITAKGPKGQPKLIKVAVLMTDGIYNTKGGHNFGDASSEAEEISGNAVTLCTNMKAAGIKVYTVGFQLGGSELAMKTLKDCASRDEADPVDKPSYFFSAADGVELRGVFRQIALQLSTLRLRS